MELRQYWELLRKWLWLIILTTLVAGVSAFVISIRQTPVYQASTRLLVTQGSEEMSDLFGGNSKVTGTFAHVLSSRSMIEAAAKKVGLTDIDINELEKQISVQPLRDTQLIDLQVEHISPAIAADLANALPVVFSEFYTQQQTSRFQESKRVLQAELDQLDTTLQAIEAEIQNLRESPDVDADSQRSVLQLQLSQLRSSYSNTLSQLESIQLAEAKALDTLAVVDVAKPDYQSVRPRVLMNTLLAAIVGLMIGLGAAFLIEYLDDTVKNPDDVGRVTGLSTLGVIVRQKNEGSEQGLVTVENPRSPVAEAYRTIRTSIQFSSIDKPIRSLVVTSAGPSEGKSTTAANLAVVMAQTGKKTILIDADLRKPTQHKRFGLPNTVGLTGALLLEDEFEGIEHLLTPSGIGNLWLITSGQLPHNPSELLGSQKLHQFAERLLQDYDFLIFDSPPALAVTDPAVLGQAMDGVLLVVDSGNTREPALMQTMREMEKVQAHVIGVALNRFKARGDAGYYYYYEHYADEEDGGGAPEDRSARRRKTAAQRRSASSALSQRFSRIMRRL
jgi:non-specific protein-tyrosine kinase